MFTCAFIAYKYSERKGSPGWVFGIAVSTYLVMRIFFELSEDRFLFFLGYSVFLVLFSHCVFG